MNYSRVRGFTLLEVMIVVMIIGLIIAITLPIIIRHESLRGGILPGEVVIDKIPCPANGLWYIVVQNYQEDYVKVKSVDIKIYYKTLVEK